jgi:hypothetical protein
MRSLGWFLAVAVLALALSFWSPGPASAQYFGYYPTPYYGGYYPTPYYGGYYPSYHGYPAYYTPPYYWSGNYYVNPWTRGYSYQAYSPWTNQYYYQYRIAPTYYPWWR